MTKKKTEKKQTKQAVKYDQKKVRPELLPFDVMWLDSVLYTVGAFKYEDNNWRNGFIYSRPLGALLRHLLLWAMGEDEDPDTKSNHLAAIRWNAATLLSQQLHGTGIDDRYKLPQETINKLRKQLDDFVIPSVWEKLKAGSELKKKK